MLRVPLNKRFICLSFFPLSYTLKKDSDEIQPKISPYKIYMEKIKNVIWDEDGNTSKEMISVIFTTAAGSMTGFCMGGLIAAKKAAEAFKAQNQATLFQNTYDAHKQLHIVIAAEYVKGGLKLASRLGLFCFIFSSVSTGIYIYKGKFHLLNHVYSGAITGVLFKINMGMKGAFSGFLIGSILGTLSGFCTTSLLWITGYNLNTIYESNRDLIQYRQKRLKSHTEPYLSKERSKVQEMCNKEQLDTAHTQ